MEKTKKSEIGIETLFYVFMAIIFVWILIFGFQKIFLVQDVLNENDRIEIMNDIKDSIEYCDDPLNKGTVKVIDFKNNFFNSMCLVDVNFEFGDLAIIPSDDFVEDINLIMENTGSKSTILLLKTSFINNDSLEDYVIIDAEEVETNVLPFCSFDFGGQGEFKAEIVC
ncbi:MAG: hypothetical protein PF569_06220 [Candidatus Woesearchaeota archaeon]|nr:hypothetical protein [Candidatus Woesearchaeota archaeon]